MAASGSRANLRTELDVAQASLVAQAEEIQRLRAVVWGLEAMQPRVPEGVDFAVIEQAEEALAGVAWDSAYPYCHSATRALVERALGNLRVYLAAARSKPS